MEGCTFFLMLGLTMMMGIIIIIFLYLIRVSREIFPIFLHRDRRCKEIPLRR